MFNKYKRALLTVLIVHVVLVSTHQGEFWPFSIFPMFSKAGQPWTRALIQHVDDPSEDIWNSRSLDEVSPYVVSLEHYGIDQIDYSNFISKTTEWNEQRLQALRNMLQVKTNLGDGSYWLATKVEGRLTESNTVIVQTVPMFLISRDTLIKNPKLARSFANELPD